MPTPPYILRLREQVGHAPLLLPGVSAVVVRRDALLLVRRSDNGRWALPAGIVEPGEHPAETIVREIEEETCVEATVSRLALLHTDPPISYPNGDVCQFISMTFRCSYVGGEAAVGDDEATEVGWFTRSDLPELTPRELRRIEAGWPEHGETLFS